MQKSLLFSIMIYMRYIIRNYFYIANAFYKKRQRFKFKKEKIVKIGALAAGGAAAISLAKLSDSGFVKQGIVGVRGAFLGSIVTKFAVDTYSDYRRKSELSNFSYAYLINTLC